MSYDLGSGAKTLGLPNPLKTHNIFVAIAAAGVAAAAFALLIAVRDGLTIRATGAAWPALVIATALLAVATGYGYSCLSQIRFYFGRNRPAPLTAAVTLDHLKETLRQQSLDYREPVGAVAGALYALMPKLVFAPPPIRALAEWQFRNGLILLILAGSFLVTLVLGAADPIGRNVVHDYVGFAFLALVLLVLLQPSPDLSRAMRSIRPRHILSVQSVSLLVALTVVGPVLMAIWTPPLPSIPDVLAASPYPHVVVLLGLALGLMGLFLVALTRQLMPQPVSAVSAIQETWNIGCSPALVTGEFRRAMQELWRERIPNRRYSDVEPEIHLGQSAGAFTGEILEEVQPFPLLPVGEAPAAALRERATVLCVALDAAGLVFGAAAAITAFFLGQRLLMARLQGEVPTEIGLLADYAMIFGALGRYAFHSAYNLWRRFDFESLIVWLELSGQYIAGKVEQGNFFDSHLRSSTSLVQVEGMTFRLWVAALHTMTLGRDSPRFIVSLAGDHRFAGELANRLKQFALNQATIASLGNEANAERLADASALSRAAGAIGARHFGVMSGREVG